MCAIPSFPVSLLVRSEPALLDRPLGLVGPDLRVIDATPAARHAGIVPGQTARQARAILPELDLRDADLVACQTEFDGLLTILDDFSDRVEPAGLGHAHLAVPNLTERTALDFCRQLGRQIRQALGDTLQPAIGCDSSKFTAQAAAAHTRPGTVRIVLGAAEQPFLRPLPVRLLPLIEDHQLRLGYLGIHTLGQYADLPARAVLQQFGRPGRLAYDWARGRDTRPVVPRRQRPSLTLSADFDLPLETAPALILAAIRLLTQPLARLRDRLQAVQTLSATRAWTTGRRQVDNWNLPAPTVDLQRLIQLLGGRWQAAPWEGAVTSLTLTLGEIQDDVGQQLTLFPGASASGKTGPARDLETLVKRLRARYGGGRLLHAAVAGQHLRVEQRVVWQEAAS